MARKKKNFIHGAIRHPGALRRELGAKSGQPIPARTLRRAEHSRSPLLRKRAILAMTLKRLGHRRKRSRSL